MLYLHRTQKVKLDVKKPDSGRIGVCDDCGDRADDSDGMQFRLDFYA